MQCLFLSQCTYGLHVVFEDPFGSTIDGVSSLALLVSAVAVHDNLVFSSLLWQRRKMPATLKPSNPRTDCEQEATYVVVAFVSRLLSL
jgi:hypothetical protein